MISEADKYTEIFQREYLEARLEYERLSALYKDVVWYNFETACKSWKRPWRQSVPESLVYLHGQRFVSERSGKNVYEYMDYPIYYEGPIRDAPPLPPQILKVELVNAFGDMMLAYDQINNAVDWAPGGRKYATLARCTAVGRKRKIT